MDLVELQINIIIIIIINDTYVQEAVNIKFLGLQIDNHLH
jgi:hypothetical protein